MARPRAKGMPQREVEVMQVFWEHGTCTAPEARDPLAAAGLDRAYTTMPTLIRILAEKGFLQQLAGDERPFKSRPTHTTVEVSRRLLADVVDRLFQGSREELLVQLLKQRKLTATERAALREIL